MKKKTKASSASQNVIVELIVTIIVAALLSMVSYVIVAYTWSNITTFDTNAQISTIMVSGMVFGLATGYRLRDLVSY